MMDFSQRPPWAGLARLFEGESYQFRFHLRPGRVGWLGRGTPPEATLAERRQLLRDKTDEVFVWGTGADEAWREVEPMLEPGLRALAGTVAEPRERARRVSGEWAPDFVLLRRGATEFEFAGGSVCFASGWDPREKVGRGLMEVHGPVPGLNAELGVRIGRFLDALEPGQVFERENWGLAASGELDLHPARGRARLGSADGAGPVWFRLEEQAFVKVGGTLLFLIHVSCWPLDLVLRATGAEVAFRRMLASMPEEVARYKGLAGWRRPA